MTLARTERDAVENRVTVRVEHNEAQVECDENAHVIRNEHCFFASPNHIATPVTRHLEGHTKQKVSDDLKEIRSSRPEVKGLSPNGMVGRNMS